MIIVTLTAYSMLFPFTSRLSNHWHCDLFNALTPLYVKRCYS